LAIDALQANERVLRRLTEALPVGAADAAMDESKRTGGQPVLVDARRSR
jgi:hypothetical protein